MASTDYIENSPQPEAVDVALVDEASREEWCAIFNARAREWLNMSGEEFIRKWEAGEIEDPDRTNVLILAMMIPGTR